MFMFWRFYKMEALRATLLICGGILLEPLLDIFRWLVFIAKTQFYPVMCWCLLMLHNVIKRMLLSKLHYWITVTARADNGGPALSTLAAPRQGGREGGGCRESCC